MLGLYTKAMPKSNLPLRKSKCATSRSCLQKDSSFTCYIKWYRQMRLLKLKLVEEQSFSVRQSAFIYFSGLKNVQHELFNTQTVFLYRRFERVTRKDILDNRRSRRAYLIKEEEEVHRILRKSLLRILIFSFEVV